MTVADFGANHITYRGPDGVERRGRVTSLRIEHNDREALLQLARAAARYMPAHKGRRGSLGSFLVWAALQWRAPEGAKPGDTFRLGDLQAARPVVPKRPARAAAPSPRRRRPPKRSGRKPPRKKGGRR